MRHKLFIFIVYGGSVPASRLNRSRMADAVLQSQLSGSKAVVAVTLGSLTTIGFALAVV